MVDTEDGLVARNEQLSQIENFITSRVDQKKSGILYLTGPPGTGKTMCVQLTLNKLGAMPKYQDVNKFDINCMRIQSARTLLTQICSHVGLQKQITNKTTELAMIDKLAKKFSSRTCGVYLFVFDEIDHVPKSKNLNLIKTIFSWPSLASSKLILVAISNTLNLASRRDTVSSLLGRGTSSIEKIIFKPYTASDIKSILLWYIENNENYQDVTMEPKALDMIAKTWAKSNGDIRGALNACRSTQDDVVKEEKCTHNTTLQSATTNVRSTPVMTDFCRIKKRPITEGSKCGAPLELKVCDLPDTTAVETPPPSPKPKSRATLPSVVSSIRKRQKSTHYEDDVFPFIHQIVLFCVNHLTSLPGNRKAIGMQQCYNLFLKIGACFSIVEPRVNFQFIIESLETHGLVQTKKSKGKDSHKLCLCGSESEIQSRIVRKEMISDALKRIRI